MRALWSLLFLLLLATPAGANTVILPGGGTPPLPTAPAGLHGVGHDVAAGAERLFSIDTATGAVTYRGTPLANCCRVSGAVAAWDAAGDRLFLVGEPLTGGGPRLYTVRLSDGAPLADLPLSGPPITSLEYDAKGHRLLGIAVDPAAGSAALVALNPADASRSPLTALSDCCRPATGVSALSARGYHFLARRPSDGVAYLFTIDLASLAVSAAALPDDALINALAARQETASLYAAWYDRTAAGERLGTLDMADGSLTAFGAVNAACCRMLPGIATLSGGTLLLGGFSGTSAALVTGAAADGGLPAQGAQLPAGVRLNDLFYVAPGGPAQATVTVSGSPNPARPGQEVLITAGVRAGSVVPTGTVRFLDGTAALGEAAIDAGGAARLAVTTLASGSHTLSADYLGNTGFLPATASYVQTVAAGAGNHYLRPLPGGGTATVDLTGGGAGCVLGELSFGPLPAAPPASMLFYYGVAQVRTDACDPGATVRITLTYPSLPSGTQLWQYAAGAWTLRSDATVTGNTVSFQLTDGSANDDDGLLDGSASALVGPGAPMPIPLLPPAWLGLLATLLGAAAARFYRRAGGG